MDLIVLVRFDAVSGEEGVLNAEREEGGGEHNSGTEDDLKTSLKPDKTYDLDLTRKQSATATCSQLRLKKSCSQPKEGELRKGGTEERGADLQT